MSQKFQSTRLLVISFYAHLRFNRNTHCEKTKRRTIHRGVVLWNNLQLVTQIHDSAFTSKNGVKRHLDIIILSISRYIILISFICRCRLQLCYTNYIIMISIHYLCQQWFVTIKMFNHAIVHSNILRRQIISCK